MRTKLSILIVDDDSAHRLMLNKLLGGWGYDVFEADDGAVAIEAVRDRAFDLLLMDVRMVKISGMEAMEQIKIINPAIPIIIMTAYASVEAAVEAIQKGAYDYLIKPLDFDKLKIAIGRATEQSRLRKENEYLRERLGEKFDRQKIVGKSSAMARLLETVEQVAPTQATVLITGESGTGKELIANSIHHNSSRRERPFVKINCAALTETLLEAELFGHEKGAFTGADRRREGKFLQADGGSLFLDEVSEMSAAMQAKLLRVLQEKELTRVGGQDVLKIDVRIIAASNKDLKNEMLQKKFREDLYYRLNVVILHIPALRERKEDIPLLAQNFLQMFAAANSRNINGFSPQAMDKLIKYSWPGNIRELMNTVERAVVLSRTTILSAEEISLMMADNLPAGKSADAEMAEKLSLHEIEKKGILEAISAAGGNKSKAARLLGITRKTLRKKLEKYEKKT